MFSGLVNGELLLGGVGVMSERGRTEGMGQILEQPLDHSFDISCPTLSTYKLKRSGYLLDKVYMCSWLSLTQTINMIIVSFVLFLISRDIIEGKKRFTSFNGRTDQREAG